MTRQTYIEVYPTRRWPGFLAIVWHGSWIERDVRQVFFGRDRAAVEADAQQYAAAISGPGVDDPPAPRRGRPPKITPRS